jgi:uncharacterized membrane protein YoaK (UPF0700 family)
LLWLGLISGGVAGAALFYRMGLQSLWVAALGAGGLTIAVFLMRLRLET